MISPQHLVTQPRKEDHEAHTYPAHLAHAASTYDNVTQVWLYKISIPPDAMTRTTMTASVSLTVIRTRNGPDGKSPNGPSVTMRVYTRAFALSDRGRQVHHATTPLLGGGKSSFFNLTDLARQGCQ
jgi:hypothetical protein